MVEKIRVTIIDDERLARDIIKNYLSDYKNIKITAECSDGFEGIKAITNTNPHIIFLDIQMPKLNGFELIELLENPPIIIFTTAFDQYALRAFDVNATDYLLKPFSKERMHEALERAIGQLKDKGNFKVNLRGLIKHVENEEEYLGRVVFKVNQKIVIVPIEKIKYLEAQDDYIMFFTEMGKFLKQKTMKYFEEHLNPKEFVRIHRSYIVRLGLVKKIELFEKDSHKIITNEGISLPISKSGYLKLKKILD